MYKNLNPQKALIFRITHRDNVAWVLDNGLHCSNSNRLDPDFISIGNQDLINKRLGRIVPIPPGGSLGNYIPFYFTPFSIMMLNITTGYNGVKQRSNEEIVIFVSSLPKLQESGVQFVFCDRHAYLQFAKYSSDLADLEMIDWAILQARDFKADQDYMEKKERYQAEALVHQHMPVTALLGMICYNNEVRRELDGLLESRDTELKVVTREKWYF